MSEFKLELYGLV